MSVSGSNKIGYWALRLAMSQSLKEEEDVKAEVYRLGLQFVVTEIGGNTKLDFQRKFIRSILGAGLNSGIISKVPNEYHALLHATEEAKKGLIISVVPEVNLAVKVSIVREDHWIAVGIFGESAIHPMTEHERCGLGIMNI